MIKLFYVLGLGEASVRRAISTNSAFDCLSDKCETQNSRSHSFEAAEKVGSAGIIRKRGAQDIDWMERQMRNHPETLGSSEHTPLQHIRFPAFPLASFHTEAHWPLDVNGSQPMRSLPFSPLASMSRSMHNPTNHFPGAIFPHPTTCSVFPNAGHYSRLGASPPS